MTLWWLQDGWKDACCRACGVNIWSTGGDPDHGVCYDCFMEEHAQRETEERMRQEHEADMRAEHDRIMSAAAADEQARKARSDDEAL